ncbi:MAG: BrnA antitoxin family protein [Methylohalobius sp.]|nr:BrnA antitoxin family protein [Methylohalobius sp.]
MGDISKKVDPEQVDEESPEWTDEMFSRAKSFDESDLPKSFKQAARRSIGESKIAVTVAYSREVIEYFRATGEGWQKRMNEALKEWIAKHSQ